MTAHTVIPPSPSSKVETKPASAPVAPQKAAPLTPPRAYWGDRFTIKFWLFCFAAMAAMTLVEAVHRFLLYLFGNPSSPP
jgi:hypothetical protein